MNEKTLVILTKSGIIMSDIDLGAILPTSLAALNETLPSASLPPPLPPPSIVDTGGASSDDDSSSNSDDE